jgi:diguanylate cyclase (GGDEF)-like protein/PAS domain S-box-containing protein
LPLTGFLVNTLLAAAVLDRSPHDRANRIYALLGVGMAYWCALKFLLRLTTDPEAALLIFQLSAVGWCPIPAYVLHFAAQLTGAVADRRVRFLVGATYVAALAATITAPIPGALVAGMTLEPWGYVHIPGPMYRVWALLFVVSLGIGLTMLIRAIRRARSPGERTRFLFVGLGLSVPASGALVTNMVLPMLGVHVVELGEVLSTVNAIVVGYAMLRHGLLDVSLEEASEAVVHTMGEALIVLDPTGRAVRVNDAAAELFGLPARRLRGRAAAELFVSPALAELIAGRGPTALKEEADALAGGGAIIPILLSARVLRDRVTGGIRALICVARDVRDLRALIAQLESQVQTDALTGAASRRHAETRLIYELRRARRYDRPISIALVDLDDFKQVNDRFGHGAGDGVLRRAAQRMRESLRESDVVARWGGDEFLLLLPESDAEAARVVCDRILTRLAEAEAGATDGDGTVRASIGIATVKGGEDSPDIDTLLRIADEALYEVKRSGKGRAAVHES